MSNRNFSSHNFCGLKVGCLRRSTAVPDFANDHVDNIVCFFKKLFFDVF